MIKKQKQSISDIGLFRREMQDVTPLKNAPTTDSRIPRARICRPEQHAFDVPEPLPLNNEQNSISTDDGSSHRKNGVQVRVLQKLKRGRFTMGGQLDLHSMTMESGQRALLDFLAETQARSSQCVRIIHGKGLNSENGPRLKIMTRDVLRNHPGVLAFVACKPTDGGSGATDVLLKL